MTSLSFKFRGESFYPQHEESAYFLDYPCETHKECYPIESTLPQGLYLLEVWGAQGGSDGDFYGGRGGYSSGILTIKKPTKAFFFIGAEGTRIKKSDSLFTDFSFNGGGIGCSDKNNEIIATSGGGGTDIRLINDSLYNRVIVAGGGGGSNKGWDGCFGGAGGGKNGGQGQKCDDRAPALGTPGTQYEGGTSGESSTNGNFGSGGNKTDVDGCGGGGGWYGGGTPHGYISAGSGGSGFIYNSENYETAQKSNLTLPREFFLQRAFMISGNNKMPTPSHSIDEEIGHSGNGYIVITIISNSLKLKRCKLIKYQLNIVLYIFIFSK